MSDKMREALAAAVRSVPVMSGTYSLDGGDDYAIADAIMALAAIPTTDAGERAAIERAIRHTEYKYFGDYEMSDDQRDAVDQLVLTARRYLAASSTSSTDVGEDEVRQVSRAIHEHLSRRDIMQYLDNDEDCEGLARAAIAAIRKGER